MIYIETGSTDVYYNFALEYYFTLEKRLPETVFLFWRTTPTLMVGKYQNVLEEINKVYADEHGIHLVRRMSGGGTIYTDMGGWQFTFIQHKEAGEIEFSQYIAPVIGALREVGVNAAFNGRNDLTIDGKKFSGNAQYRLGDCIVHHGSLLFDTDIAQMVASTTVDSYKITSKSIKSVRDRVTNISEHLPAPMDAEAFKETMVRHIMNGSTATYTVTPEDDARIREIAGEQFRSWERIFGRSPKFTIDRTGRFAGGKVQFKLDVQRGLIRDAAVYGDFFSTLDADTLCAALMGCPYERGAVLAALRSHGIDGAVYRISAEELFEAAENGTLEEAWGTGTAAVVSPIGELAEGLDIDLNKVPKKYEGLDGTELAISESQERMAVAVAAEDAEKFIALANEENLEATVVATVTEEKRMRENWNGVAIVDLSREFLNSNGAERHADVHVLPGTVWQPQWAGSTFAEKLENLVGDLNVCSQKGLGERFDSTIGASTVLMPYGGKYQLTPTMAMAAKLPVDGETTTCSGMAWGFNPYLTEADPYRGAYMAVVESVTKLVCAGFRHKDMYLTFQEYFEHLNTAPERWGKPLAALLGALDAQMGLGIASIGGKDSMSGSFEGLDVPPTLVSFATAIGNTANVMSPEFKKANSSVACFPSTRSWSR